MIINGQKIDAAPLDADELDKVTGGLIIPATDDGSPMRLRDTVVDERTMNVIGQTDSTEAAVDLARSMGVSTERISWSEYVQLKNLPGAPRG